jgi:hypothetical protein
MKQPEKRSALLIYVGLGLFVVGVLLFLAGTILHNKILDFSVLVPIIAACGTFITGNRRSRS